ncbi:hypothetical protein JCM19000A_20570 [Silvimonas sp. JCM 19000]
MSELPASFACKGAGRFESYIRNVSMAWQGAVSPTKRYASGEVRYNGRRRMHKKRVSMAHPFTFARKR